MNFCNSGIADDCPLLSSSSSKKACIRASELIPKTLIETIPIMAPTITKQIIGKTSDCTLSAKMSTFVMTKYPMIPEAIEMKIVPRREKRLPRRIREEKRPRFLTMRAKPSKAAVQKFLPLKAISIYACLLMNSIVF